MAKKRYTKPALTLDQQIDLLLGRGITIEDRDEARRVLQHTNYHRLRPYWEAFEVRADGDGDHRFGPGADLAAVVGLYEFDRRLRLLVADGLERFEVSFRTRFAYELALEHGPHGYLDARLFRSREIHAKNIERIRKEYDRNRTNGDPYAVHYATNYDEPSLPPLWAVVEFLSFGDLSHLFGNLRESRDRRAIAGTYGLDEQIFGSVIHHLAVARNFCAHHRRLWNRRIPIRMKVPGRPAWLGEAMIKDSRGRAAPTLYNTLVVLAYLLGTIDGACARDWKAALRELLTCHPHVNRDAMGFPAGWEARPPWSGFPP